MTSPLTAGRFHSEVRRLAREDGALGAIVEEFGEPPFWQRPAGFPSLVLFILEQQVSLASAAAAYRRIKARIGEMDPIQLLGTSAEELRADGVSRQKDRYIRALAVALIDSSLSFENVQLLSDDEARRQLMTLPGIGRWTADVFLLACLGRPDVWPTGDRALQVAAAEALSLRTTPDPIELEAIGERWKPSRAVAARLLWHGYLARRKRSETPTDLF